LRQVCETGQSMVCKYSGPMVGGPSQHASNNEGESNVAIGSDLY
jgi:hypothetical protein